MEEVEHKMGAVTLGDVVIGEKAGGLITWTAEEVEAILQSKQVILARQADAPIEPRLLCATCLNCKLRPETTADKYLFWLNLLRDEYGVTPAIVFDQLDQDDTWERLRPLLSNFQPCGKDEKDRSIFWIKGSGGVKVEDEALSMRAGMLYWLAVHSDWTSLRQGISFVVDTGGRTGNNGNEKKLQKANQAFPLRPQRIMILGTNFVQRIVINALISFASLFTKDKIVNRISFASIEDTRSCMPVESLPVYAGGKGANGMDVVAWTRGCLAQFPAVPEQLLVAEDDKKCAAGE